MFAYHEKIFAEIMKQPATHMTSGGDETRHLLQDVYDKFERLSSLSSMYYDLCGDLSDGYLAHFAPAQQDHAGADRDHRHLRPAGIPGHLYGMNFDYIPSCISNTAISC